MVIVKVSNPRLQLSGVRSIAAVAVAVLSTACAPPDGSPDASSAGSDVSFRQGAGALAPLPFDDNPGALNAYLYEPTVAPAGPAPLVVAMHACSQTAASYRAAGWEELADEMGFYVLYPEQTSANNSAMCFNWAGEYGDPTNLRRGEGENQSIIGMIEAVKALHPIDDAQIFLSGHSGGGAQVALMMATWPDVFAGAGIYAGIPYHCTTVYNEVSSCLSPGIDKTPEQHAQFVLDAYPGYTGSYPKLSLWHGTADFFVQPMNQVELLEQWATVHGIDTTPDATGMVGPATRSEYHDAAGNVLIETFVVTGAGHATFNSPSEGCGTVGAYFEDVGLCGARLQAEFWGLGMALPGSDTDGSSGGGDAGGDDGGDAGGDDGGGSSASASGGDDDGGSDGGSDDDGGGGDDSGTDGLPAPEAARDPVKGVGQCAVSVTSRPGLPALLVLGLGGLGLLGRRRRRRTRG